MEIQDPGEYAWAPAVGDAERLRLMTAVESLMFSDKDPAVRESAGLYSGLERMDSPSTRKRAIAERRRIVRTTDTPIRLVDAEGRPVAGAVAAAFLSGTPTADRILRSPRSRSGRFGDIR